VGWGVPGTPRCPAPPVLHFCGAPLNPRRRVEMFQACPRNIIKFKNIIVEVRSKISMNLHFTICNNIWAYH
jgi:hypothetical protein